MAVVRRGNRTPPRRRKIPGVRFKAGQENPGSRTRRPQTGAGRVKGTPNKVTATIRQAVTSALDILGGEQYLVKVGRKDPRAFTGLLGKAMPLQVEGGDGAGVKSFTMKVAFRDPQEKPDEQQD